MYANWKIDTILDILKEAGRLALTRKESLSPELKKDLSVVTASDIEIETMFARYFDRPGCGSFMIGEESNAAKSESEIQQALQSDCCYIVDPIDGTSPYTVNLPVWGCSIGLMRHGILTEGAIYQPETDIAYITSRGTVWRATGLQGNSPEILPFTADKKSWSGTLPVSISTKAAKHWHIALANQVFAWGCCVADYIALLEGKTIGGFHSAKLWDVAGGLPILKNAGFCLRYSDGREFDFDIVNSGAFELQPGKCRWQHKKNVVFAPDANSTEIIWNGISGNGE